MTATARDYGPQGGEMYQISLDLKQKPATIEHFFLLKKTIISLCKDAPPPTLRKKWGRGASENSLNKEKDTSVVSIHSRLWMHETIRKVIYIYSKNKRPQNRSLLDTTGKVRFRWLVAIKTIFPCTVLVEELLDISQDTKNRNSCLRILLFFSSAHCTVHILWVKQHLTEQLTQLAVKTIG